MPDNPEYEKDLFLQYYGEYLDAKEQNHPLKIWLKAVHCRVELQKLILLPYQAATEEAVLRQILAGFVSDSQAGRFSRNFKRTVATRKTTDENGGIVWTFQENLKIERDFAAKPGQN